jgi:TRAP-type C4-dicarboxylate transport system permease small subunit
MRVVFDSSLTWSEEASRFAFVWFAFLGASYAARLGAHNRVTFQFKLIPKLLGNISQAVADLIWIAFNTVMTLKSIETIQDMLEFPFVSPALDLPMHYVYMLFPITFTLMTIRIIQVNILKFVFKVEMKDVDDVTAELDELKAEMEANA